MIGNLNRYLGFVGGMVAAGLFAVNASSPVVISEFMARNSMTLADEDGDYSDWIELHNDSIATVNLDGWYLTDRSDHLTQWRLPATNLAANGYLVVFASGKNRSVAGAPLHTSFPLSASGEYLALVMPDGHTIATEFAPAYPEQPDDVSFGFGQLTTATNLVSSGAEVRFLIPDDGGLGLTWTSWFFADSAWFPAKTGIGFATNATTSASGLFAYWPIAEGGGNVASNLVEGAANGVIHGATWVINDPVRGTVLSFNGQDSYVSAGTLPPMGQSTSNFTWSFWLTEKNRLLTQFFPARTAHLVQLFKNAGLYPKVDAPAFNEPGAHFTNQFILTLTAPQGTVYFTTDGTDPRLPGGGIAPAASAYGAPVTLTRNRVMSARSLSGGVWSALNQASFSKITPAALRIELSGASILVSWPLDLEGFLLEAADPITSGRWDVVPGVAGNFVIINPGSSNRFYRLRRP